MNSFVKIDNLEKIYPNGVKAVYNFNLDIQKNEFIVLVGPSGCGKSTMLRMIAGLEDISSGELTINGEYANYKPSKDRGLAIVFQNYALYPQMNVFENIAFPLTVCKYSFPVVDEGLSAARGAMQAIDNFTIDEFSEYIDENGKVVTETRKMTKWEIQDKVFAAAEVLDLGSYLNRLPKELSGGQMQRVALGRAIVKNVPLFLMDEPLSNLDARLRLTMRSEIVKLHKRINATTVYVTHDQTEAMTMADRIVVMSKGFVQQIDTPEQIYNNPCNLFVAKFVGTPPINILTADFNGKKLTVGDYELPITKEKAAKINEFYDNAYAAFSKELAEYDGSDKSKEFILKVLSATADKVGVEIKRKATVWQKILGIFKKKQTEQAVDKTLAKLKEKTELLNRYRQGDKQLTVGIRPESLQVEIYDGLTPEKDCFIVEPTLVELMGSEFYVHFDFYGEEMIAKMLAGVKIDEKTKLALRFNADDLFIFDPVSGEKICR